MLYFGEPAEIGRNATTGPQNGRSCPPRARIWTAIDAADRNGRSCPPNACVCVRVDAARPAWPTGTKFGVAVPAGLVSVRPIQDLEVRLRNIK